VRLAFEAMSAGGVVAVTDVQTIRPSVVYESKTFGWGWLGGPVTTRAAFHTPARRLSSG
jgi:hypothetical protein